jgi:hypothetical protein
MPGARQFKHSVQEFEAGIRSTNSPPVLPVEKSFAVP